jgi:hypothetical protein
MRAGLLVFLPLLSLSAAIASPDGPKRLGRRASADNTVYINSVDDYCLIVSRSLRPNCVELKSVQLPRDPHTDVGTSEYPVSPSILFCE